jgi:hypothetical protein
MDRVADKLKEIVETTYKDPQIFGIIALIANIVIISSIYYYNPYDVTKQYPIYTFLVMLLILLITLMTFFFIRVNKEIETGKIPSFFMYKKIPLFEHYKEYIKENGYLLLYLILTVISIYFLSYFIKNNDFTVDTFQTLFVQLIDIAIFIGALALIYTVLKYGVTDIDKNEKRIPVLLLSLFKNIIFYIPCLFIDIIEYVKLQYNITTKTIWIVLFIEIILILLYLVLPILFNSISTHDGVKLLNECIYLNNKRTLGSFESLHKIKDKSVATPNDIENSRFKYTYAISAWYYINPQPPNTSPAYTKFSTILDYGKKPLIQFNSKKNTLRVQCETSKGNLKTLYETQDIKYQKWNNIVVNYDGGTMDVFINGLLVSSTPELAPYMTYENVIVGQENGIQGGICNVMYYKHILSSSKINMMYKLLRNKQIPVI